jgi:hypothetical protein
MSRTLSTDTFIKLKVLRETLDTHSTLNDTDKKYMYNLTSNILKTVTVDFNKYNLFLLYTNKKTNTGRFCLTYNEFLDDCITKRNEKVLTNLITDFKENVFFEFYDNKLLDENDKKIIKNMCDTEFIVLKNTIDMCIKNEEISKNILAQIYPTIFNDYLSYAAQTVSSNPTYIYTEIPENIFIKTNELGLNKIYIFNLLELLLVIYKENKNIQTGEPFDIKTFEGLNIKYDKEIKMIKRYYKGKK